MRGIFTHALRIAAAGAFVFSIAACGGTGPVPQRAAFSNLRSSGPSTLIVAPAVLHTPALITNNTRSGELEFWPISSKGGKSPQAFTKHLGVHGGQMAANGSLLAIAAADIVLYDASNGQVQHLADPNGTPYDLAIDKGGAIYSLHFSNKPPATVSVFAAGSHAVKKLACSAVNIAEEVAVDNESDVFIGGWGKHYPGVWEIPAGSQGSCEHLDLKYSQGPAGLAVDPKTDDLITLDNPSQCAGGEEGRMIIYPKPYHEETAQVHVLGGNCTGGLKLNADSTIVFYGDNDVCDCSFFIRQSTYPAGRPMHAYYGGVAGGWTTIPNSLPN